METNIELLELYRRLVVFVAAQIAFSFAAIAVCLYVMHRMNKWYKENSNNDFEGI